MAPIIKTTNYRRRTTCRTNVPPILTLRKKEEFDLLLNNHQVSNPFSSSSEADSTNSGKSDRSTPSLASNSYLFFPKTDSSPRVVYNSSGKWKKFSKVKKTRPLKRNGSKSSELIEYEKVISEFLRDVTTEQKFSLPLHASTPLKDRTLSTSNAKTPYSPITQELSLYKKPVDQSNCKLSLMVTEFSKLSCAEFQGSLSNVPTNFTNSMSVENFLGFSSTSLKDNNFMKNLVPFMKNASNTGEDEIISFGDADDKQELSEWNEEHDVDEKSDISKGSGKEYILSSPSSMAVEDEKSSKNNDKSYAKNETNTDAERIESLSDTPSKQEVSEWNEDKYLGSGKESMSVSIIEDTDLFKNSNANYVSNSINKDEDKMGSSDESHNKQEVSEWNRKYDQVENTDAYTGSSLDEISDTSDKNYITESNQNEAKTLENSGKILINKKELEEQSMSIVEEKELANEIVISESPCCEKESVIIICEPESLVEDDEDKSEDVSSALSSDQEAREGISSSDLESNSIDEEKEFNELRRHSFEKITPRKSIGNGGKWSSIGPFSRRRCLSMVPSVSSQGSESYLPTRDHELSNKHFINSDNMNDQSPKHSLLFNDPMGDSSDEERISGRSPTTSPTVSVFCLYENSVPLDPLPENLEENQDDSIQTVTNHSKTRRSSEPSGRRRSNRLTKDLSPSRQSPLSRSSVTPDLNMVIEESDNEEGSVLGDISEIDHFILPANKKYRRSLSIIRQLSKDEPSANVSTGVEVHKGRGYEQFVDHVIKLQAKGDTTKATPTRAYRKSLSIRRSSLLGQRTPPRGRRASSRISTPTSPISYHQLPLKRPSLSASLLVSCNRSQHIASPFRLPLQPNQTLLQNISRYPNQASLRDSCLKEDTGLKSGIEVIESEDYKDHVLILCEQKEPTTYFDILDDSALEEALKVGEGVYGEVFMVTRSTRKNVLKIIPIEGDFLVNGEKQKGYEEIYTELIIAKWLDQLRDNVNEFMTNCFAELVASWVIKGKYPDKLVELWDDYDERKGSDNDRPDIFNDDQLYLVLELGNAGTDLESYSFSTAKQALSIFKQTVFAIAVAEACFEFEHRDLHWGNVLISRTAERYISFRLNGKEYKVISNGVKSTIIDYTLSRITFKNCVPIYNDIGQDPDMFIATGDYQFDIYRHMKKDVCDRWDQFVPKTNVRWLHYLIDKMLKKVKYQRKTAKVHRDSIRCLQEIESWILNCDTSVAVALKIAEDY